VLGDLGASDAERAGIDQDLEIGPGALALNRVRGIGLALVVLFALGGDVRDQLPARGETHDAHALGIDVPLLGLAAHHPNGALGVLDGVHFDLVRRAFLAGQAILEYKAGDAMIAEPLGGIVALVAYPQAIVSAAGSDDQRRAGGLVFGGKVRRDR